MSQQPLREEFAGSVIGLYVEHWLIHVCPPKWESVLMWNSLRLFTAIGISPEVNSARIEQWFHAQQN